MREDVYDEVVASFEGISAEDLAERLKSCGYKVDARASKEKLQTMVLEEPAQYLAGHLNALRRPEMLTNVFIEFNDGDMDTGHTYLIDAEAAEQIASNDPTILLRDGGEGAMMPRTRIEKAFAQGCEIDYRRAR